MKIYLLSQTENKGFSACCACVVVAADENAARNIDPWSGKKHEYNAEVFSDWCSDPSKVCVDLVGEAAKRTSTALEDMKKRYKEIESAADKAFSAALKLAPADIRAKQGIFWDKKTRRLSFALVPMAGVWFEFRIRCAYCKTPIYASESVSFGPGDREEFFCAPCLSARNTGELGLLGESRPAS